MKLNVCGVKRVQGTSKESGNPFDMPRLFALVPVEAGGGAKFQVTGYGFELAEINLDPACLPQFAAIKFPAVLELVMDSRPFRGKLEMFVTGVAVDGRLTHPPVQKVG